jgi:hypothetical protein
VDVLSLFERVPVGWTEVTCDGRRYGLSRTLAADGRAQAIYAEELGGRDVISANLYLTAEPQLRPCEMPAAKVLRFLEQFEVVTCNDAQSGR